MVEEGAVHPQADRDRPRRRRRQGGRGGRGGEEERRREGRGELGGRSVGSVAEDGRRGEQEDGEEAARAGGGAGGGAQEAQEGQGGAGRVSGRTGANGGNTARNFQTWHFLQCKIYNFLLLHVKCKKNSKFSCKISNHAWDMYVVESCSVPGPYVYGFELRNACYNTVWIQAQASRR